MKKQEIKMLSFEQMKDKLEDARRELFSLRLNAKTTTQVKDYSQFDKKRKQIARLLTFMRMQPPSNS